MAVESDDDGERNIFLLPVMSDLLDECEEIVWVPLRMSSHSRN